MAIWIEGMYVGRIWFSDEIGVEPGIDFGHRVQVSNKPISLFSIHYAG